LCETGNPTAGRTHLAELLKRDAKDKGALHALAKLEDQEERWDASSAAYRRLLPLEDGEALIDVALKLSDACERADRLVDARSGLERALKASPANTAIRAKLRDVYLKTDAHGPLAQLILEDAAKETDVSGRFALLLTAASFLLGQEGNPAQAIQVLEEARNLRPEDDDGVVLLGRAYAAQGRSADALTLLQTTLTQRKGRRSKSLSAMQREISHIHSKQGDRTKALEALTKAFDMDLHNGEIALELGLLARDLDQEELASRAFRSVTFMKAASGTSNEGATPAAKGLSYFFLGQMARAKGDVRKARLMAQKAVIEDPTLEQAKALLEELKSA
jgi:tetratricopeptide (TPR) repeat protein